MNKEPKIVVAYFGRLEPEKGLNELIEASKNTPEVSYLIFGKGSLSPLLPPLTDPQSFKPTAGQIHYFGYQDFQTIIKPILVKLVDYTIMPSQNLETFGLSALQSIELGIPVIGQSKGALKQFIQKPESLTNNTANAITKKLNSLKKPTQNHKQKLIKIAHTYSRTNWLKNLQTLLPKTTKKILLVTDFLQNIGGTEDHFHSIKELLSNHYQVQTFGTQTTLGIKTMLHAINNKTNAKQLQNLIIKFQPDVIWCHSILRKLGPQALKTINKTTNAFKIITHHDLGLITAKPSKISSENQILGKKTFSFQLKQTLLLNKTIQELKHFNLHIIPSPFMKKHFQQHFKNIKVLSHFSR